MKKVTTILDSMGCIFLSVVIALGLMTIGCGGGGGSSSPGGTDNAPVVMEGTFEDSPVEGLEFTTASKSGVTDSEGTFTYRKGETVTFFIGDIILGQVMVKEWITPLDLVEGATSETHPTVTNICRFLQALDDDDNPDNGIHITASIRSHAKGKIIDFEQNETAFENQQIVQQTIASLTSLRSAGQRGLVPIGVAQDHLRQTIVNTENPNGIDQDNDGYKESQNDCNDNDLTIHPGADEICGDGIDQDCSGSDLQCAADSETTWYKDTDGDGYSDGLSLTSTDRPGNGYYKAEELAAVSGDCNDNDGNIYPAANEVCGDSIDQDCTGSDFQCSTDSETTWYKDTDGDGYSNGQSQKSANSPGNNYYKATQLTALSGDCDDNDRTIHPKANEICGDGIDQDCSGKDLQCTTPVPNLTIVGSVEMDTDYAKDVHVSGSYAYVANEYSGLQVIDISNPQQPVIVGSTDTTSNDLLYANGVYASGSYAYVVDNTSGIGFQVVNVENPQQPVFLGRVDSPFYAHDISVSGPYAYVVDDTFNRGLKIIDITNPQQPAIIGSMFIFYSKGVDVSGSYAYVADGDNGLDVIDISNPRVLEIAGHMDTPDYANAIYVSGSYAYVADGDNGLEVADIRNPQTPVIIGNVDTSGYANAIYVSGSYAYVADGNDGLEVVDIRNPQKPVIVDQVDIPGYTTSIYVRDAYAYVTAGIGLYVIRIFD